MGKENNELKTITKLSEVEDIFQSIEKITTDEYAKGGFFIKGIINEKSKNL